MAADGTLTLTELADTEEVTPRTVRYYIAQGLLPPPIGAGPLTRYGVRHQLRLRLIRELQRQHLPLAEIRSRLERLRDDEVAEALAAVPARSASPPAQSALQYIRAVLSQPGPGVDRAHAAPPPSASAIAPRLSSAPSAPPPPVRAAEAPAAYADATRSGPGRAQWERITLSPDIELHVRRPLSRAQNRAVDRLVGMARKLLEEDSP